MRQTKTVRVCGLISLIAGVLMVVTGGAVWGFTTNQLGAQQITVPGDASFLAGSAVDNPLSALAQATTIGKHQQHGAVETLTANADLLATVGVDVDPDATYSFAALRPISEAVAGGVEDGSISADEAAPLLALRDTANQAAAHQSALFTSVIAFGVAALIMGLGALTAVNGFALTRVATVRPAEVREPEPELAPV